MSRASGVKAAVHSSAAVVSVTPSGDCLFQCFAEAFAVEGRDVLVHPGVAAEEGDDASAALRRTCAAALDDDAMEQFKMFCDAGLPDFNFVRKCMTLADLQAAMLVAGRDNGSGKCIWAGEFEIATLCSVLRLSCLILDLEARSLTSRYVAVHPRDGVAHTCMILQRTRRQHYNLVTLGRRALFSLEQTAGEQHGAASDPGAGAPQPVPGCVAELWGLETNGGGVCGERVFDAGAKAGSESEPGASAAGKRSGGGGAAVAEKRRRAS